jgi:hypothetical protein
MGQNKFLFFEENVYSESFFGGFTSLPHLVIMFCVLSSMCPRSLAQLCMSWMRRTRRSPADLAQSPCHSPQQPEHLPSVPPPPRTTLPVTTMNQRITVHSLPTMPTPSHRCPGPLSRLSDGRRLLLPSPHMAPHAPPREVLETRLTSPAS